MVLKLTEHGQFLGSRFTARAVREEVEEAVRRGEVVQFDFAGVESTTESFVHELLRPPEGWSVPRFFGRLAVSNCNPEVEETIRFVAREAYHSTHTPAFG